MWGIHGCVVIVRIGIAEWMSFYLTTGHLEYDEMRKQTPCVSNRNAMVLTRSVTVVDHYY